MKKLTLEQWEKKYIAGPIERFNQKNTMYARNLWDSEVMNAVSNWGFSGDIKDKAGMTLKDNALRFGCRRGTDMGLLNTSKPNTAAVNKAIAAVLADPKLARRELYRPPPGAKLDITEPEKLTKYLKKYAIYAGADLVGICKLDRRWVYSNSYIAGKSLPNEIPDDYQYAIIMGFEEDYNLLKYFPTYIADAATSLGYSRMAITNTYVSEFIRGVGYKAIDCTTNDVALTIPMAMQAGLGQIGRNGLLVTPTLGPRLRLSKVFTNLELVADQPIEFGVTEFCTACKKCAKYCPSQAIMNGEITAEPNNLSNMRNRLKWPINAEKCRIYWSKMNKPCTTCISVCPFNKVENRFHSAVRWFVENIKWADSIYVKMDDALGYGKPHKAEEFWDKWEPEKFRRI
ncbi:MAG: reductive dehalogenase [Chloroflexi bacterium]|nr:reductive dehalogenase [Chloroflexota bacterium]